MKKVYNFLNNRTMNALNSAQESKEYIKLMVSDIFKKPDIVSNDWKKRYHEKFGTVTEEQKQRLNIYIGWLRCMWVFSIAMLFISALNGHIYNIFYYTALMVLLYTCLGYRIWVLNTKLYPPFIYYIKLLKKYPTASLPLKKDNIL